MPDARRFCFEAAWPCESGLYTEHRLECWVDVRNDYEILEVFVIGKGGQRRITAAESMAWVLVQVAAEEWVAAAVSEVVQERENQREAS